MSQIGFPNMVGGQEYNVINKSSCNPHFDVSQWPTYNSNPNCLIDVSHIPPSPSVISHPPTYQGNNRMIWAVPSYCAIQPIADRERERERTGVSHDAIWGAALMPENLVNSQQGKTFNVQCRPGDWVCSKCDAYNYSSRKKCYKCSELKEGEVLSRPGDWWCGRCHGHNYAYRKDCFRCKAHKSEGFKKQPLSNNGETKKWVCPKCQTVCIASPSSQHYCRKRQ